VQVESSQKDDSRTKQADSSEVCREARWRLELVLLLVLSMVRLDANNQFRIAFTQNQTLSNKHRIQTAFLLLRKCNSYGDWYRFCHDLRKFRMLASQKKAKLLQQQKKSQFYKSLHLRLHKTYREEPFTAGNNKQRSITQFYLKLKKHLEKRVCDEISGTCNNMRKLGTRRKHTVIARKVINRNRPTEVQIFKWKHAIHAETCCC